MLKIIYKEISIDYNDNQKTLLQTLEANGIKTFSMCKEGYCNTCSMQLLKGEVDYIEDPISYLEKNEILPCICKPKTDIVITHK